MVVNKQTCALQQSVSSRFINKSPIALHKMDDIATLVRAAQTFNDEKTFLLKMTGIGKALLWLTITGSLSLAWFTKILIYAHIFKTKLREQPINILILIEQFVQHYCGNFVLLSLCLSLLFQISISEMVGKYVDGETFCWVFYYTAVFNTVTAFVDGLAVASLRLLYLLKGTWLKYKFGERRFIILLGFISLPYIFSMTYLFCSENIATRSAFNVCVGRTQTFEVCG